MSIDFKIGDKRITLNRKNIDKFIAEMPFSFGKAFVNTFVDSFIHNPVKTNVGFISDLAKSAGKGTIAVWNSAKLNEFLNIEDTYESVAKKSLPEGKQYYMRILMEVYDEYILNYNFVDEFNIEEKYDYITQDFLNRKNGYSEEGINELKIIIPIFLTNIVNIIKLKLISDPNFNIDLYNKIYNDIEICKNDILSIKENADNEANDIDSTCEFYDVYNMPAFLDEKISLNEIYICPFYFESHLDYKKYIEDNDESGLKKNTKEAIEKWLNQGDDINKRMKIIFGEPGSGKSTLISYILNNFIKDKKRKMSVICLRNLNSNIWSELSDNIHNILLKELNLKFEDLNNMVLILDGLDEVNLGSRQVEFINILYQKICRRSDIKNFNLLITCRTTRINNFSMLNAPYIIISPFTDIQIRNFIETYSTLKEKNGESYSSSLMNKISKKSEVNTEQGNNEIFSIIRFPLILYMILALNVNTEENTSIANIYNEIFSIDGKHSIYLHQNYNIVKHAVTSDIASEIHEFSKEIAFRMWSVNPSKALLPQEEYIPISHKYIEKINDRLLEKNKTFGELEDNVHNLLIGQFFIEGQKAHELCFVHRSMYEFFTALSIVDQLKKIKFDNSESRISEESFDDFAEFINMLNTGYILSPENKEIKEYIVYLLNRDGNYIKIGQNMWADIIDRFIMYKSEMFLIENNKRKIIDSDAKAFYNLVFIAKESLLAKGTKIPYKIVSKKAFNEYKMAPVANKDMSYINLKSYDLSFSYFSYGDFKNTILSKAKLYGTNLQDSNLYKANLQRANLQRAHLARCDLTDANLQKTNLYFADLQSACWKNTQIKDAVMEKAVKDYAIKNGASE